MTPSRSEKAMGIARKLVDKFWAADVATGGRVWLSPPYMEIEIAAAITEAVKSDPFVRECMEVVRLEAIEECAKAVDGYPGGPSEKIRALTAKQGD